MKMESCSFESTPLLRTEKQYQYSNSHLQEAPTNSSPGDGVCLSHCCNQRHNNEVEQEQYQVCSMSVSTVEEDSDPVETSSGATKGNASVMQTALNVAKTCMGTGTLALPYAASQGGYICSTLGFILMALWNLYCVDRMLQCNHLLHTINRLQQVRKLPRRNQSTSDDDDESSSVEISNFIPSRTSAFGKVIWTAIGSVGLACYEIIMIVLLLGIIIAYEDASMSFISKTHLTSGSKKTDALWVALAIIPLSCAPNISFLSKFSALGVGAIFLTFLVIFAYGIIVGLEEPRTLNTASAEILHNSLWPRSATGLANWFGVAAFSFGVVPITYNIQESMKEPELMVEATRIGLKIVMITYLVISNGVSVLFSNITGERGFQDDVLRYLPDTWISELLRLTMASVVLFTTAPILVVCCGEMIEKRYFGSSYEHATYYRLLSRASICIITTSVSVYVPGFVLIIGVIGCCCVAVTSFILPTLCFILLSWKKDALQIVAVESNEQDHKKLASIGSFEYFMLVFGILSVFVSSYLTVHNAFIAK